jgi:hypothetical protein
MAVLLSLYAILGIGLFGGYAKWCENNRILYGVFFPVHWFVLVYLREMRWVIRSGIWSIVEPIANLVGTVWKVLWSPALWILVFIWLWLRGDLSFLQDFFGSRYGAP